MKKVKKVKKVKSIESEKNARPRFPTILFHFFQKHTIGMKRKSTAVPQPQYLNNLKKVKSEKWESEKVKK